MTADTHQVDDVRSWGTGMHAIITWTCTCGFKPRKVMHVTESKTTYRLLQESHYRHVRAEYKKTTSPEEG